MNPRRSLQPRKRSPRPKCTIDSVSRRSSSPWNEPASKPIGLDASSTRSNPRTVSSLARSNGHGNNISPSNAEPKPTSPRSAPADPAALTAEELAWLSRAGADVRTIFDAPTTTARERKQLLRALITEVVVTVHEDRTASLRIVWEGGATSELTIQLNKSGGHLRTTDEDTVALVRRLAEHYDDRTIAVILARQGRRTGTGLPFNQNRVKTLRVSRHISAHVPVPVTPTDDDAVVVNVREAAAILHVSTFTVHRWLRDGFLVGEQLTPGAPWRIRIDDTVRAKVVPDAPEGWLSLDQAAQTLGVARQTVLHKVQRGELTAVHVNRGRRRGLRIQVKRDSLGLFDQPR